MQNLTLQPCLWERQQQLNKEPFLTQTVSRARGRAALGAEALQERAGGRGSLGVRQGFDVGVCSGELLRDRRTEGAERLWAAVFMGAACVRGCGGAGCDPAAGSACGPLAALRLLRSWLSALCLGQHQPQRCRGREANQPDSRSGLSYL